MHAGSSRSGESVVRLVGQSYDTLPYRVIPVGVELSCKPCHVPMLQPVISTAHYGVRPTTSGHSVYIYGHPHVDAYNKVGSWKTIAAQSNAPNLASAGDSQSYHRKASQSVLLHTRS